MPDVSDSLHRGLSWSLPFIRVALLCLAMPGCGGEGTTMVDVPTQSLNCKAQVNWAFALPSGKIAVYTHNGRVLIWDLGAPHAPVSEYGVQRGIWDRYVRFPAETLGVWGLYGIANNRKMAVVVYDFQEKKEKYHYDLLRDQEIGCITTNLTGKLLVWTEADIYDRTVCAVKVVDLTKGSIENTIAIPVTVKTQMFDHLAIAPDDTIIAGGSNEGEGAVAAINMANCKLLWKAFRNGGMGGIAFHPDGKSFYASGMGQVIRYEALTGKELASWSYDDRLGGIAVSSDGSLVAVGATGSVVVFDANTGKHKVLQLQPFSNSLFLFFSLDEKGIWVGDATNRGCLELIPLRGVVPVVSKNSSDPVGSENSSDH